jgi:hypothetical protein
MYLVDQYVVLPRKDRLPAVNKVALPQVKLTLIGHKLPLSQKHGSPSIKVMGLDSHAVIAARCGIENLDQNCRGQEYCRGSIVHPGMDSEIWTRGHLLKDDRFWVKEISQHLPKEDTRIYHTILFHQLPAIKAGVAATPDESE